MDLKHVDVKNENWPKWPPESDARPDILALVLALVSVISFAGTFAWWAAREPTSDTWGPTWPWVLVAGLAWSGVISGGFGLRRAKGVAGRRMALAGMIIGVLVGVLSVVVAVGVGTSKPMID